MGQALIGRLPYESEEMKFALQEELILEVTEAIAGLMQEKHMKKKDLAQRLGRSKGYITQLLNGRANMTLRTIADVFWALDATMTVNCKSVESTEQKEATVQYGLSQDVMMPWEFSSIAADTSGETQAQSEYKLAG